MSERKGRGIFDCPECHVAIIGGYGDLLKHVKSAHPLAADIMVDGDTGLTLADRIKKAQKKALKADIQDKMVVSKQNQSSETQREDNE